MLYKYNIFNQEEEASLEGILSILKILKHSITS